MEKIFKQSIDLFGDQMIKKEVKEIRIDTTVQEKNITYPTDRKLYEKAIQHCKRIANANGIKLKRTYTREIKKLRYQLRFAKKPKNFKRLMRSQKKLHRIAIKNYSDLVTQMNPLQQKDFEKFDVLYRVLTQQHEDKDKVYSIHEPEVLSTAKGKDHKPYEFGNKSSFAYTRKSGIIVGAMAIEGNAYDGHTLKTQLDQVKELTRGKTKKAIVNRGFKIQDKTGETEIVMPNARKRKAII